LIRAKAPVRRLTALQIDRDGGLPKRRLRADLNDGIPDGICWHAHWQPGPCKRTESPFWAATPARMALLLAYQLGESGAAETGIQSQPVTELAISGQFLMVGGGQVPMTANSAAGRVSGCRL